MQQVIEIKNLYAELGGSFVLEGLNLSIERGEVIGIAGGSGAGKTTLLRNILMLVTPYSGSIKVFGEELIGCDYFTAQEVRKRWGVMFQQSALFSSLTVLENIMYPLELFRGMSTKLRHEIALLKLSMVGLPLKAAVKYPAQLSGGMRKRAALARALVIDPELVFLDEPTSGLDPKSADAFDDLIVELSQYLSLTVMIITHDLDTLWRVTNKVAFLGDGQVIALGSMAEVEKLPHPLLREYFSGPRGCRRIKKINYT